MKVRNVGVNLLTESREIKGLILDMTGGCLMSALYVAEKKKRRKKKKPQHFIVS